MHTLGIVLFIGYLYYSFSLEPSCKKCKWFSIPKGQKHEYGLCKFFANIETHKEKTQKKMYEFAQHCRQNNNLCSPNGYFYEPNKENKSNKENKEESNKENIDTEYTVTDQIKLYNKIQMEEIIKLELELFELKNKVYGEVNENYELDKVDETIRQLHRKIYLKKNQTEINETEIINIDMV